VYPSAGDLAKISVPKLFDAPGLLSTITGCPKLADSLSPTTLAIVSIAPPGGAGTMILIVFVGYDCAKLKLGSIEIVIAVDIAFKKFLIFICCLLVS
jgi:hypothetical protein